MRFIVLGASALMLAGCGGEEYPVPAREAMYTLTTIGTPQGLYPLPIGLDDVTVAFETVPDQNFVRWEFRRAGEDLATIFAQVEPNGDTASNVRVSYAEGPAPDDAEGRNGKISGLLERQIQQLVVEAVDAKFEKRPFDERVRNRVSAETAAASMGALMKDVVASRDAFIEGQEQSKRESESMKAMNPANAGKPMTDLSKFN